MWCYIKIIEILYLPEKSEKEKLKLTLRKVDQNLLGFTVMIFLFMVWIQELQKGMEPNREALEELFTAIMSTGVEHTNPTHGTLAGAIADEKTSS